MRRVTLLGGGDVSSERVSAEAIKQRREQTASVSLGYHAMGKW